MGKIFNIALFIALFGVAWNILALALHLLGIDLPTIDSPFYPG